MYGPRGHFHREAIHVSRRLAMQEGNTLRTWWLEHNHLDRRLIQGGPHAPWQQPAMVLGGLAVVAYAAQPSSSAEALYNINNNNNNNNNNLAQDGSKLWSKQASSRRDKQERAVLAEREKPLLAPSQSKQQLKTQAEVPRQLEVEPVLPSETFASTVSTNGIVFAQRCNWANVVM
eukprot:g82996.t1